MGILRYGIILALLLEMVGSYSSVGLAAQPAPLPLGNQWTLPQQVPGYDNDAMTPYLIVDSAGTIHAFNSIRLDSTIVVVYSFWTENAGWSAPIDILISPLKSQARVQGAFLDDDGYVHLLFWGGDDLGASMFHSKAHLSRLNTAQGWSEPMNIADDAITPTAAVLVGNGKGDLYVVFSGDADGVGLYYIYSDDGGDNWSEAFIVSLATDDIHWPTALSIVMDDQERLHLVWTLVNVSGNGDAVMYSRYEPESGSWSDPTPLAVKNPGDYEADWGTITFYQGELIVVYQDSSPATRWMRRSFDGGVTWTDPVRPFAHLGEYRHVSFVEDSAGYLHMFLGNRTPNNTHGMWHSVWLGDRWSDLEPLVTGPRITEGTLNQRFDPTGPVAAISRGNQILVTWWTDPGAGRNGVWWSRTTLRTPQLDPAPVPTLVPVFTPTPNPTQAAVLAPTPTIAPFFANTGASSPTSTQPNPAIFLMAGTLPVALMLGLFIVFYRQRLESKKK
jgi:hypothetical protein